MEQIVALLPDAQGCEDEAIEMCVYEAGRVLSGPPEAQGDKETAEQRQQVEGSLEKDRGLSFKGLSEAHISYGDEDGTLVLIFERRGLNWVLVDGELKYD